MTEEAYDIERSEPEAPAVQLRSVDAQLSADISSQWSWASSAARIPQISDLVVSLSEAVPHARITVSLDDADLNFGRKTIHDGPLPAGLNPLRSVHVPLSARVMSQVADRHPAVCALTLEIGQGHLPHARMEVAVDVQPRDLWLWGGDPRSTDQQTRLILRHDELVERANAGLGESELESVISELESLRALIERGEDQGDLLSRSLLASFVRPNHPEVAAVAREAAGYLERATGDSSFFAFQLDDVVEVERRVEQTVTAIYEALRARAVAYSEPPPGWDYRTTGQRIRDHGDVARGGLGTCMDTTVLTGAVMEQVGLLPVLVLVPGHIFVGYWRRKTATTNGRPEWYSGEPVLSGPDQIDVLVEGGFLGLIETTAFTTGRGSTPAEARDEARWGRLPGHAPGSVTLIDVTAARRAGVSPLPAVTERADGVTEVVEYRPGGAPAQVDEVTPVVADAVARERRVDGHPARYRTWKASLFSLNATNALLNLGSNARVQPLALPPEALGQLEDKLHQDVAFTLRSGYDVPEVWRAREVFNALQLLPAHGGQDPDALVDVMNDRQLFVQRLGRLRGEVQPLPPATFVKELRSMAHHAKTSRDERGMNPLFLCLGMLRWPYKPGLFADAPLILVPVTLSVTRGRQDITLKLDPTQQTTPNAALMEWLRREHSLTIPGLAEPLADRAGIDVDAVLREVRAAVAERGLPFDVTGEARLATLDLSAFRMWQDLNTRAEGFLDRPLVRHLVHSPTEQFEDPAVEAAGESAREAATLEELEKLETPIPADSTQKRAVLWAKQGRTFVLQGPPGTGKSQTITNMVAECVLAGQRVLFVAEKGTALAVVQRRLDAIGLGPFTLNLHHEGSNATQVRAQLKRSLTAAVAEDPAAMESARRRLRTARFELTQYPQQLHERNAAGLSAYAAHDQLLVLDEGETLPVTPQLVAHQAAKITELRELFEDLQTSTAAAGVRPDHPWRLAGPGGGEPFDPTEVAGAVTAILDGAEWSESTTGPLREAIAQVTHPTQLRLLLAATDPVLPHGETLTAVLADDWPATAASEVDDAREAIRSWRQGLKGFAPEILTMDLDGVLRAVESADESGFLGRKGRQAAAVQPLVAVAPPGVDVTDPGAAATILRSLIAVRDIASRIRDNLGRLPGLAEVAPTNGFADDAMAPLEARLAELVEATGPLRALGEWTDRARVLARGHRLADERRPLTAYVDGWQVLWDALLVREADFEVWRSGRTLHETIGAVRAVWRRQVDFERLLPLQRWCQLVRRLEPLQGAGLASTRVELLDGRLPAYLAEDALARGVARASLDERVSAAGLDRFNAVTHDQRVTAYSDAQAKIRRQWVTDGPARLLERRGGGGMGAHTGGLARELEKTTRKLGTRPILRKHGAAVQELTPLVLCSPSSVVDLIEPGVMEFDVVIFDEASQITVPEAVGALGRAAAAIVVGDSKQMPPTRKVGGGPLDEEESDDPDAEEIVEDQESILSECELARVPTLSLSWHYRSQDEALIAFSNRAYYRGDLSSFPTPTLMSSATGVEFRRVQGQYLRAGSERVDLGDGIVAGNNTNPIEAQEIVRIIHEMVHAAETLPSVGIATFNEQQRQLIEDLLVASRDPRVADVMDESKMGRGEALFVKALEQVQGDERDTIIFSIAFSKQANGKIPTNFGPLSNAGGERRLNVAVTRARRKNLVVCSFEPSELDVSGSAFTGPKDLKEFLAFAKSSGASDSGENEQRVALRDRHRDDIAATLRERGLHVMSDVGLSNFRLDLVLSRSEEPSRPLLPVLLDGESWMKRSTVSDRDVLPVEVLQNLMGWPTVARVWWPMWLQNRDEVIEGLLSAVEDAHEQLGQTRVDEHSAAPIEPAVVDTTPQSVSEPSVVGVVEPHTLESVAAVAASPTAIREVADVEAPVIAGRPADTIAETPPAGARRADPAGRDPISEFVPAHTEPVGGRQVLDALPDPGASASVLRQIEDVIMVEGPIEMARLTRIVARRFGLGAVRAARGAAIRALVPKQQVVISATGTFVWPVGLDPMSWMGFRIVGTEGNRTLDEIPAEEIANAMATVASEYSDVDDEGLLRLTAELFGITRLGPNVRSRLETVARTFLEEERP